MDQMLLIVGLLSLAAGLVVGYLIANIRSGAKASEVKKAQAELDQYREKVTEHFSETADHFRTIGQQYRALHEHMVAGATELCDTSLTDGQLTFTPAGMLEKTVEESAEDAVPEHDEETPSADDATGEPVAAAQEVEAPVEASEGADERPEPPPAAAAESPSDGSPAAAPESEQAPERTLH